MRKAPDVIIMSKGINRTADKRVKEYAAKQKTKLIVLNESVFMELVIKENCKAIAINEINLAKAIIANIGEVVNEQK